MQNKLLEPFKLKGNAYLPNRLMPGPMEGVMTPLLCQALAELNLVDYWVTPFIRISEGIPHTKTIRKKLSYFTETNLPIIVQLLGCDPFKITETAKRIADMGFLGVNINFACPSKRVMANNGGSKLLTEPKQIETILSSLYDSLPNFSISAKIRMGYNDFNEYIQLAYLFDNCDFTAIHFRTAIEGYQAIENIKERLELIKQHSTSPTFISGDIFTENDAINAVKNTGSNGAIFARGLLKDPFIIEKTKLKLKNKKVIIEDKKIEFMIKLQELINRAPEKYLIKANFIELSKHLFGAESDIFKTLTKTNKKDFQQIDFNSIN
jgi:tRNA-dihydrouridine synthase